MKPRIEINKVAVTRPSNVSLLSRSLSHRNEQKEPESILPESTAERNNPDSDVDNDADNSDHEEPTNVLREPTTNKNDTDEKNNNTAKRKVTYNDNDIVVVFDKQLDDELEKTNIAQQNALKQSIPLLESGIRWRKTPKIILGFFSIVALILGIIYIFSTRRGYYDYLGNQSQTFENDTNRYNNEFSRYTNDLSLYNNEIKQDQIQYDTARENLKKWTISQPSQTDSEMALVHDVIEWASKGFLKSFSDRFEKSQDDRENYRKKLIDDFKMRSNDNRRQHADLLQEVKKIQDDRENYRKKLIDDFKMRSNDNRRQQANLLQEVKKIKDDPENYYRKLVDDFKMRLDNNREQVANTKQAIENKEKEIKTTFENKQKNRPHPPVSPIQPVPPVDRYYFWLKMFLAGSLGIATPAWFLLGVCCTTAFDFDDDDAFPRHLIDLTENQRDQIANTAKKYISEKEIRRSSYPRLLERLRTELTNKTQIRTPISEAKKQSDGDEKYPDETPSNNSREAIHRIFSQPSGNQRLDNESQALGRIANVLREKEPTIFNEASRHQLLELQRNRSIIQAREGMQDDSPQSENESEDEDNADKALTRVASVLRKE